MNCRYCNYPIERTIEGEPVCPTCWTGRQMTSEELEYDKYVEAYHRWSRTHCEECGEYLQGGGICPECQDERDHWLDIFDEIDWGDGEISPDEELRRAALDYKGRP